MPAVTNKSAPYVTVTELATLLGATTDAVYRWTVSGWLPVPIRLGPARRWIRWRREVIEQFLRDLEEAPRDQA